MEYKDNTSIVEYASNLGCEKCITFYNIFSFLLKDLDCIVCRESAADLFGYSNGGFRNKIMVYTEQVIDKPYLDCIIVDSLADIPSQDYKELKVSPIEVAIVDMLASEETDSQILFETHGNYYCEHNDSYDGLIIPPELMRKAQFYQEEGKKFYYT